MPKIGEERDQKSEVSDQKPEFLGEVEQHFVSSAPREFTVRFPVPSVWIRWTVERKGDELTIREVELDKNDTLPEWPTPEEVEAYWKRKDDEYEAYLEAERLEQAQPQPPLTEEQKRDLWISLGGEPFWKNEKE